MKSLALILAVVAVAESACGAELTNAPAKIELKDQFDAPQVLSFPRTNLTLLTIADRKGSEQIAAWVAPLAKEFGPNLDVRGIADMSAVPRLLRGTVKSAFRKQQSYPVMLDWSGAVVRKFHPKPDLVNVFLLDQRGAILLRYEGLAKPGQLEELRSRIREHSAKSVPDDNTSES